MIRLTKQATGGPSIRRKYEKKLRQTSDAELLRTWKTAQSNNLTATTMPTLPAEQETPLSELRNPMEGRPDAWQLSETASEFLKRCPPLSSEALGPWLWVSNPDPKSERRKGGKKSRDEHSRFTERCEKLLSTYLQDEERIQAEMNGRAKGAVTRKLTPLRTELRAKLLAVAKEEDVVCGKVSRYTYIPDYS